MKVRCMSLFSHLLLIHTKQFPAACMRTTHAIVSIISRVVAGMQQVLATQVALLLRFLSSANVCCSAF